MCQPSARNLRSISRTFTKALAQYTPTVVVAAKPLNLAILSFHFLAPLFANLPHSCRIKEVRAAIETMVTTQVPYNGTIQQLAVTHKPFESLRAALGAGEDLGHASVFCTRLCFSSTRRGHKTLFGTPFHNLSLGIRTFPLKTRRLMVCNRSKAALDQTGSFNTPQPSSWPQSHGTAARH